MKDSGDYISSKALLSAVEGYGWKEGLKTVLKRIPAADVRPNVPGKFYLQYNGDGCWHCSECNYQARYPSNFCPNCGADMRGES